MKILAVYGTRPEKLKLDPVVAELEGRGYEVETWWSGQSPDLMDDEDLADNEFRGWSENINRGIGRVLADLTYISHYDAALVVGDTATAFAGAVAGFLADVPVGHVEAGLRTYEREPWPEEAFRGAIARFADLHFAPDEEAGANVARENGEKVFDHVQGWLKEQYLADYHDIFVAGNPSIDALGGPKLLDIVATFHRRENWGERIENALKVLTELSDDSLVEPWVFTHPNWKNALDDDLSVYGGIHFLDPTDHATFLQWLRDADVVVTDSGGVQEECAALGTDCLVYRTATERKALENFDAVEVVDPRKPEELRERLRNLIDRRTAYGRGNAAANIADILEQEIGGEN